ncbi:MAG TPA: tetratricopeptide repeat protein [Desulfobacterales bacterium]|nr:tetratricopeptide repeat protein [Desulfobacterales bacterium]
MTYPDDQVAEMLNRDYIPVQVDIQKASKLADRYQALWTPNLNVIDGRGRCVYQTIGWLPPMEFAAMLQIGRGYFLLNRKKFEDAARLLAQVIDHYPDSIFAAEAMYFKGVSRYMASQEAGELQAAWTELQRRYPDTQWAMKSDVL